MDVPMLPRGERMVIPFGVVHNEDHDPYVASEAPGSLPFDELQKVSQAIDSYHHILSSSRNTDDSRGPTLHLLSGAYATRFQLSGNLADINQAILCCNQAVSLVPESSDNLPQLLGNLGSFYMRRFDRLGDSEDIKRAVENNSLALALTPSSNPQLPLRLDMLGLSHLRRFEKLGDPADLHFAVDYNTQAIANTADDDPDMAKELCNLGAALQARFEHLGVMEDIDRSIEVTTQALGGLHTPPDLALALNNLGTSYMIRFLRLKEVSDIDKAIEYQTSVISLLPEDVGAEYFSALGNSHSARFEHLKQYVDISSAMEYHVQAMSRTRNDDPELPLRLTNIGICHCLSFQYTGRKEELDTGIDSHSLAVSLSSEDHSDYPARLDNLGSSYALRFELSGELEDLHMGIEYLARSISLLPPNYSELSSRLNTLGSLYLKRYTRSPDSESNSFNLALASWERSSQLLSGYPVARFQAALKWADTVSTSSPDCLRAYAQAMSLVPRVVWLGASVGQRYKDVPFLEDVSTGAVAAAIDAQNYYLALEWLEQGRSVVWNQILQLRTSLKNLSEINPQLANQLTEVASGLDQGGSLVPSSSIPLGSADLERHGAGHRRLAERYESLIDQVRLIPGFENFQQPKKASELFGAAQSGPIVILNAHSSRCDALILLPGSQEIKHVPLCISQEKVKKIRKNIDATLDHQGVRTGAASRKPVQIRTKQPHEGPEAFEKSLAMLWTNVVKPVLDCLGYERQETVETLPHITWCATGALSALPLHASGDYGRSSDRLSGFAISSYTPTLGALLLVPPTPQPHTRLLAIGQEHTPGQPSLPATVVELAHIQQRTTRAEVRYSQFDGSRATREAVLQAMEAHDWVHLACHAHQNMEDPTKSGFFLHDGVLSLATITQKSFKNKGLAFLSACQTATGDSKLPDESVHLASGMLIAGYPSVIATMWSIRDDDAPVMAETVYGQLVIDGKMNHKAAAKALHIATMTLRARVGEREFTRWVPYIHIGQ